MVMFYYVIMFDGLTLMWFYVFLVLSYLIYNIINLIKYGLLQLVSEQVGPFGQVVESRSVV